MLKLRYHHLFCIPLYSGSGYSDKFCEKMEEMRNRLIDGADVEFICESDDVCSFCPNNIEDDCGLDTSEGHISDRDKLISSKLDFKEHSLSFSKAICRLTEVTDKDFFSKVCGKCRWYKAGYCNFEQWAIQAQKFKKIESKVLTNHSN